MRETGVRSLGREDPLEQGTATHSSVPAWRAPWTEEPGGLQSRGCRVGQDRGQHRNHSSKQMRHERCEPRTASGTHGTRTRYLRTQLEDLPRSAQPEL